MKAKATKKKILILGGFYLHEKLVDAAHELGYTTIVVDNIPDSSAKLISDQSFDINITEVDRIVELCKKECVSGVITGYIDFCQRYYQIICEKLQLPCYGTYNQFQILTNKDKFKTFCVQNGIDVIPSYLEEDFTDFSETKVDYPVYVKPSYSRGSRGQFICNTKTETLQAMLKASEISNDGKAIIEKYMKDKDNFQVTYFVLDGEPYLLRTADQYQGDEKLGLDKLCLMAVSPSKHTDLYIKNVHPRVVRAIKNLGIENGPVFMQGFVDGETVRFYDPGLRFPGTDYSVVLKKHLQIDMAKALVEFSLSGRFDSLVGCLSKNTVFLNGGYVANFFPTVSKGIIKAMPSKNDILKIFGVENISFRHKEGDLIEESGDVNQRIAEINIWVDKKNEIISVIKEIYGRLYVLDEYGKNLVHNYSDMENIFMESNISKDKVNYINKIRILTQQNLIEAGCMDFKAAVEVIEKAFIAFSQGKAIFPEKTSVVFNEASQDRINCLPAAILDEKVYGMKWISVFPHNPYKYKKPTLSAVSILSELETGFPFAFMSTTMCSNMRTAAVGAVAAKYLARNNSRIIGFIGAGEQAKSHFLAMMEVFPSINECRISSRTSLSEQNFIAQMQGFHKKVNFIACNTDYKRAVVGADIVVTAISGQNPILKAEWISNGTFYCHVAGLEDEVAVALKADKIICDNWEAVKHRTQTISLLYKQGLLCDEDIYADLHEIIVKNKKGRESDDEIIYFNSVGLSFLDTALSHWMYKKAVSADVGLDIILTGKSMFDMCLNIQGGGWYSRSLNKCLFLPFRRVADAGGGIPASRVVRG